ncbi:Fur family transcriptional regulator [Sporichthya polymorpha]|uniref:Fur family transcriptional regulator n=1 Tax=Sporichthya polymorpha TaxID=35751 RepID=UPI00035D560A|nr:transcriptional repressor [Sporichthya polymorpha]
MSQDWRTMLREKGYRLTPQRELVLAAVTELEHATPEQVCARVQETASGINISTVYRTLELLEELGLVRHAHLGHGAPSYHPAGHSHHLHLVCRDCGAVSQVESTVATSLTATLQETEGFEVDLEHFAIYGRCRDCRQQGLTDHHHE